MYPAGHMGSAYLAARAAGGDPRAALLAALVPDLIDKSLAWVLGLVPYGRNIGHSLVGAALLTLAVDGDGRRRRGFLAGYLVHLLGDVPYGHVPWLLPFRRYSFPPDRWRWGISTDVAALEILGALVLVAARRERHPHRGEGGK